MHMPSRRIKAATGRSAAKVYDPYFNRTVEHFCSHQHTPNKPEPSGFDAVVFDGRILCFAHPVLSLYHATGAVMHKQLFVNALRAFLGTGIQVETENLPSTGRVTLMRQDALNRTICHILYAPTILRGGQTELGGNQRELNTTEIIEDLVPLYNVKVSVKTAGPVRRIVLQPENREIPFAFENGKATFTVPEFTCHTMAVIE